MKPYRLTDPQVEDMKTTVNLLREVIHAISLAQGWSYLSIEQRAEVWAGEDGAEMPDALPALRRTFLLLEER